MCVSRRKSSDGGKRVMGDFSQLARDTGPSPIVEVFVDTWLDVMLSDKSLCCTNTGMCK